MAEHERDALVALAERGWWKMGRSGRLGAIVGGCPERAPGCLLVLLGDASETRYCVEVIREQFPERVLAWDAAVVVTRFNDHEDTTVEDVVLVLEKAALRRADAEAVA